MTKKQNQISYQPLTTKIISLHKGSESVKEITPGASISIETNLDPFLSKTDSLTGCVVSTKGNLPETTNTIKISSKIFKEIIGTEQHQKIEPIKTKETLMISINTTITVGVVEKIDVKTKEIELLLNSPIIALKGDNLGIARNVNNHWRLIGFGEIL